MARINITDLENDIKISEDEMKQIRGGARLNFPKVEFYQLGSHSNLHKTNMDVLSFSWGVSQGGY